MTVLLIENLKFAPPYHKLTCTRNEKSVDLLWTDFETDAEKGSTQYKVEIEDVTLVKPASRMHDPISKRCVALPDFTHAGWILGDDVALNRIVREHGLHELIAPEDETLAEKTTHLVCLKKGNWSITGTFDHLTDELERVFLIETVTGDAVKGLERDMFVVLTKDGKLFDEPVINGIDIEEGKYVTLAVRYNNFRNTSRNNERVITLNAGDIRTLTEFKDVYDDPYPDTYRKFEIVGLKELKATNVTEFVEEKDNWSLERVLRSTQTDGSTSLPRHATFFELFPTTLETTKSLTEILRDKTYGEVRNPDDLDSSPTLNCMAVSLLIVEYFWDRGIKPDLYLSNKHAIVRVNGKFVDGTQYLRRTYGTDAKL